MQRNFQICFVKVSFKKFHVISWNIKSIFPSQPDIFLLQNHPFQAFLVSKTYYTFIHEEKKTYICSHMSVKAWEGGGAKGLSGYVRYECEFFLDGSPN